MVLVYSKIHTKKKLNYLSGGYNVGGGYIEQKGLKIPKMCHQK